MSILGVPRGLCILFIWVHQWSSQYELGPSPSPLPTQIHLSPLPPPSRRFNPTSDLATKAKTIQKKARPPHQGLAARFVPSERTSQSRPVAVAFLGLAVAPEEGGCPGHDSPKPERPPHGRAGRRLGPAFRRAPVRASRPALLRKHAVPSATPGARVKGFAGSRAPATRPASAAAPGPPQPPPPILGRDEQTPGRHGAPWRPPSRRRRRRRPAHQ